MVLLTITRTFNISYKESVLYRYIEIAAQFDIVSFVGSSQIVTVPLIVRDPVARLNV